MCRILRHNLLEPTYDISTLQMEEDYKDWLIALKQKIGRAQLKVAVAANTALLQFYWELGKDIAEKLESGLWGTKLIENLASDLKKELPSVKGFSRTNLYYIKQFYEIFSSERYQQYFVPQSGGQIAVSIVPHFGGQLPWGHIKVLLSKTKTPEQTEFYLQQTLVNNWNRDILGFQIKNNLYGRKGKAITNFHNTLPEPQSQLAQETIKDPYVFDFLDLTADVKERDIENQLVKNVSKFLLELGKGFAFIGKQYHLEVAEKDYYIDLLFYHVRLKCYVIIDLLCGVQHNRSYVA